MNYDRHILYAVVNFAQNFLKNNFSYITFVYAKKDNHGKYFFWGTHK